MNSNTFTEKNWRIKYPPCPCQCPRCLSRIKRQSTYDRVSKQQPLNLLSFGFDPDRIRHIYLSDIHLDYRDKVSLVWSGRETYLLASSFTFRVSREQAIAILRLIPSTRIFDHIRSELHSQEKYTNAG